MKILLNLSGQKSPWLKRSKILGKSLRGVLEALVRVNQMYIATHRVPALYESGVRYQNEPTNLAKLGGVERSHRVEEFAAIPAVIERGWGDCDDLAPWRVAELRELYHEKARIHVYWKRMRDGKGKLFHICVRREDGSIEDPSAKLGMRN